MLLGGMDFGNLPRKIYWANGAEFCHAVMIWIGKSAQKFLGQSRIYK